MITRLSRQGSVQVKYIRGDCIRQALSIDTSLARILAPMPEFWKILDFLKISGSRNPNSMAGIRAINGICELVGGACSASVSVSGDCITVSGYSESPIDTSGSVTVCANGFPAVISNDFNGCVLLLNSRFCGQITLTAQLLPPLALSVTASGAPDGEGQAIDQCIAVPMSMSK